MTAQVKPFPVGPLKLPAVSPDRVRLFNAASLRGRSRMLAIAGTPVKAVLTKPVPDFEPALRLGADVNGRRWGIALRDLNLLTLHPLFSDPETAGTAPESLPPALLAAVAEVLAEPVAAALSQATATPIAVTAEPPAAQEEIPLAGFALSWTAADGTPAETYVRLTAAPGAAAVFADSLRSVPRTQTGFLADQVGTVPFVLSTLGGGMTLAAAEYKALEAGDILLPETWLPRESQVTLSIRSAGRTVLTAPAQLDNCTVTLREAFAQCTETTMTNTDELEVKLTFEIENRLITAGELKSLEPGYTFQLTGEPTTLVTVLANGRPVARGRLVDIGGAVGVELTQRAGAGDER